VFTHAAPIAVLVRAGKCGMQNRHLQILLFR
jgi:hypothetical protein